MSGIPAGAGQLLGKRLGKYEIVALLALGGTAEIYLARIDGAAGFEKYVVVKCLHDHLADDAEFVKMFLDEARLAAHLDHSNIVQTMELGQHEGRYYMVMEFLAGLSLAMIVRRAAERLPNERIPVPLVLNILAQACAGLHYAHEKAMNGKPLNIVHRDISPQNLVISFEGVVKVVDFGIAKAELRETRTRSGTIKGKFAYMSPEQCVANNVDRRTDVFALGVISHELLTGHRLFKRTSPYETYQAVIECDVKPPSSIDPSLDPALDPVIMRAIAKDKEQRYPTAEAFGDALLGYLHHRGIGSGPGDVSRFFDAHFAQEIEEHSARMRELISGREIAMDAGVNWGADEPEDEARREEPEGSRPEGAAEAQARTSAEPGLQGDSGLLSGITDELGGASGEDEDEMPAERTRIESNPYERIKELDRISKRPPTAQPQPAPPPVSAPSPVSASPPVPAPPAVLPRLPQLPSLAAAPVAGGKLPPSSAVPLPAPPPGALTPSSPVRPAVPASGESKASGPQKPASGPLGASAPGMPGSGAIAVSPSGMPSSGPIAVSPSGMPASGPIGPEIPSAGPIAASPPGVPSAGPIAASPPGKPSAGPIAASPPGMPPSGLIGPAMPSPEPIGASGPAIGASGSAMPPSGRFPDLANLPTMISASEVVVPPAAEPGFGNTATSPASPGVPPAASAFANAPTSVVPPRAPAFANAPTIQPPPELVQTQIAPLPILPGEAQRGFEAPPSPPPMSGGYPVLSAQLSEQIANGATVFPSEAGPAPSSGHPGPRTTEPSAPSGYPQVPPRSPELGQAPLPPMIMRDGSPLDPQRAANLLSPVGQYYPEQVDWAAAAAKPARAVPPWLLAILFLGAIGIATALTIVVAKIIR